MARRAQAKYEISAEDKTRAALASAQQGMTQLRGSVLGLRSALGTLAAAFSFQQIIANTSRQQAAVAQLEAALRSTGGAVGYTREQLVGMAADLQKVSTFGDEAIIEAQARLVSYTGIVGTNFPRALQAVLDQSARLNIGLEQSAETLGRALESPMKAAEALSRQGFGAAFTKEVRATIRELVAAGKEAEAQAVILGILEDAYGGAALAARQTFGGALQSVKNAFGDLLEADGNNLRGAVDALEELTRLLQDPNTVAAAQRLITTLIDGFAGVAKVITGLNLLMFGPSDELAQIDDQLIAVQENIRNLEAELARTRNPRAITAINRALEVQRAEAERLKKAWWDVAEARNRATGAPAASGGGGAPAASPALTLPPLDVSKALLERQTALVRDALNRQQQELERAYQDGLKSTAEYFRQRARLQEASLDAELQRLRGLLSQAREEEQKAAATIATTEGEASAAIAAATRAREQQVQLIGQITIAERDRAAIAGQAARDQAAAERDLAQQLDRVRIRLLEMSGQTAEARKQALEAEYRDLLTRLQAEGDTAGQALVRRLIDVEGARARLDELQRTVDLAFERMNTAEQSLQVQREAGILSESQARRELIGLHQRTAEEVQRLIPLMMELAAATGDPFAIERVRQLEIRLQQLALTMDDLALSINAAFEDGLGTFFQQLGQDIRDVEGAARAAISSIARELNKLASQRIAQWLLGMVGGGAGGGIGGFLSGFLSHSGGLAGAGVSRRIPAIAFAGAPRYHRGGLAGLRPDEVPAILRKREEVLTEDDPRHRFNLGDGQPAQSRGLKVVLVSDEREALNQLRSSEGDEVLVERLSRNRSAVLGALGLR